MKQFNKLMVTVLVLSAAGFASAAKNESAKGVSVSMDHLTHSIDMARRATLRIDHMMDRRLDFQTSRAVAAMYEAPTSIAPVEVRLEL